MTEHDDEIREEPQAQAPGSTPEGGAPDAGLSDLRARLGELQGKVELLGSQGVYPEQPGGQPGQGVPPAAPTEYTYGSPPPVDPYGAAPGQYEVPRYEPDPGPYGQGGQYGQSGQYGQGAQPGYGGQPGYPEQPPRQGYEGYQPPAQYPPAGYQPPAEYQPPAYQPPPEPVPAPGAPVPEPAYEPQQETYPPPPVATNGHSQDTQEVSGRSTTVALVDAGPFDDLIELRHFEDELSSLNAVRDVRVRRFGHGRASIEVGMTGPYSLSRELYRLGRQMDIADGEDGDLVIHLAPSPEQEPAEGADDTEVDAQPRGFAEGAA